SLFTDSKNRVWSIDVNGPATIRVRDKIGVDLFDASTFTRFADDLLLFCRAVYWICWPQCCERGVDADDFTDSLLNKDAPAIDRAAVALTDAYRCGAELMARSGSSKESRAPRSVVMAPSKIYDGRCSFQG